MKDGIARSASWYVDEAISGLAPRAPDGLDSILHLAALNGTENFYQRPELVLDVGIRGMYGMLEAARANNVKEFVLASSSEAYQTPRTIPTPEGEELKIPDPWNPRYSYGGSKVISEMLLANYNRDLFERAIIFRPHNVYGPDMGYEHVLPQFIMRAHEQTRQHPSGALPFPIQGDGSDTRSFVYIDDFLDGLTAIIDQGAHRQVYHIGTTEELSIRRIAELVIEWFGREPDIQAGEAPAGGTKRRCPDVSKLAALGYAITSFCCRKPVRGERHSPTSSKAMKPRLLISSTISVNAIAPGAASCNVSSRMMKST